MQTATEYLAKTDSAVRHLFKGIDAYHNLLRSADIPVLVRDEPFGTAAQAAEQEAWEIRNAERFAAAWHAEKKFIAELFAMDTLYGAVLQVANKALDLYGKDGSIPSEWSDVVKKGMAKYWRGRLIRTVPLGLVIHAARNQHAHFDDPEPRPLTVRVFGLLATAHGYPTPESDPMFVLSNPSLMSFASNVTGLIEWHTFAQYEKDIRALLEI
jgi:hypothetical protein